MRKLYLLTVALLALGLFAAGCGSDDDEKADTQAATQAETTEAAAPEEEAAAEGEIDEESLRAFIDALAKDEDGSVWCDPENITEDLLTELGGAEGCAEAIASDAGGNKDYEIKDLQVEGSTATAVIVDEDGETTVEFVQEGDELKVASSG